MPFLLVAGLGLVIMFLANAYLLSREYFLLAAMRFRPPAEAKAMRRAHRGQIFLAGLLIAMFVSIPIVNLATPLFAMAMMVHMHKRLSQRRVTFRAEAGLAVKLQATRHPPVWGEAERGDSRAGRVGYNSPSIPTRRAVARIPLRGSG